MNQLTMEELTERFYQVREERNKLLWASQKLLDGAEAESWDVYHGTDELRTGIQELTDAVDFCQRPDKGEEPDAASSDL